MTVAGTISRTSLSLSALPFGGGAGLSLFVGGLQVGRRAWRRDVESSRFASGEVEMGAVLDQTHDMTLRFRAKATSEASLQTLVASLVAAVEQQTWSLAFSINGSAWPTLTCTRADSDVIFDTMHVRGMTATVLVYTTHFPNASGPI